MKKLMKIAEVIADYYKSKYYDYEILQLDSDTVDVVFYSYWEPEIGYKLCYTDSQDIAVEHFEKIKAEDPELYLNIIDLIEGPKKRAYNVRPVPRSDEDKKEYFEKLVKIVNLYGPREKGFDDLVSFVNSNKKYKNLVMFRRVRRCEILK